MALVTDALRFCKKDGVKHPERPVIYAKKFEPFEKKIWLASPTMHGEELKYFTEAYETNGREGTLRCKTNAYIAGGVEDVGADIFQRGCCLPTDNKMTAEEQDRVIEVIKACFD